MPKDKERSVNPAQQQRKLEKAKALKKGKAELQARRNEKLARQNPDRLQRQVDDLKALEEAGSIKPREKQILEQLEKDLRAVRKAREALGDKAPQHGNKNGSARKEVRVDQGKDGILGKRKWDGERKSQWGHRQEQSSDSETDESVRRIPMPKDTPPPMPHRRIDHKGTSANAEPLISCRLAEREPDEVHPNPVIAQPRTTYEGTAQIRNLRKEAIGKFVPNVVRKKQDAVKGTGGLVEPEEFDRLEREGYIGQGHAGQPSQETPSIPQLPTTTLDPSNSIGGTLAENQDAETRRLAAEEERFRREMRQVEMEEVEDEDL